MLNLFSNFCFIIILVIKYPEITKNISTPTNPKGNMLGNR